MIQLSKSKTTIYNAGKAKDFIASEVETSRRF
jgi:hypothetical protein